MISIKLYGPGNEPVVSQVVASGEGVEFRGVEFLVNPAQPVRRVVVVNMNPPEPNYKSLYEQAQDLIEQAQKRRDEE